MTYILLICVPLRTTQMCTSKCAWTTNPRDFTCHAQQPHAGAGTPKLLLIA